MRLIANYSFKCDYVTCVNSTISPSLFVTNICCNFNYFFIIAKTENYLLLYLQAYLRITVIFMRIRVAFALDNSPVVKLVTFFSPLYD
jgi:hypothetical protein